MIVKAGYRGRRAAAVKVRWGWWWPARAQAEQRRDQAEHSRAPAEQSRDRAEHRWPWPQVNSQHCCCSCLSVMRPLWCVGTCIWMHLFECIVTNWSPFLGRHWWLCWTGCIEACLDAFGCIGSFWLGFLMHWDAQMSLVVHLSQIELVQFPGLQGEDLFCHQQL